MAKRSLITTSLVALFTAAVFASSASAALVDLAPPGPEMAQSVPSEIRDFQIASIQSGNAVPDLFTVYGSFGSSTMQARTSNVFGLYSFTSVSGYIFTTQNVAVSNNPNDLDLGDINADGAIDVVLASNGGVQFIRGSSSAVFNAAQSPAGTSFSATNAVKLAPINNDALPDLVEARSDGNVAVNYNTGNTTAPFNTHVVLNTVTDPRGLAIADFDLDGKLDAAMTSQGNRLVVLTANLSTLMFVQTGLNLFTRAGAVTAADVIGDSRPEVIVTEPDRGTVAIVQTGSLPSALGPVTRISTGYSPNDVETADLDQDGKLEVIVANAASNTVTIIDGSGASKTFPAGPSPAHVAVGEMNGDGRPDLIVHNDASRSVSTLVNQGVPAAPAPPIAAPPRTASLKCSTKRSRGKVRSVRCTATLSAKAAARSLSANLLRGKRKVKSAKAAPGKPLTFKIPAGLKAGSYSVQLTVTNTDGSRITARRSLRIK